MSPSRPLAITLFVAFGLLGALVPSATQAATPIKLVATVGPGFALSLTRGGKVFSRLKAGDYVITVRDRANNHNFRLVGPGVNRASGIGQISTLTWRLTLRPGNYRFLCDPHAQTMRGAFAVVR